MTISPKEQVSFSKKKKISTLSIKVTPVEKWPPYRFIFFQYILFMFCEIVSTLLYLLQFTEKNDLKFIIKWTYVKQVV